jgi:D-alanyl-D-alanine carboxypeptidase
LKEFFSQPINDIALLILGGALLCGAIVYGAYSYNLLQKENLQVYGALQKSDESLTTTQNTNTELNNEITSFQGQLNGITSTVGTLQKLSQTDPELLEKYSKVYFLNENYAPTSLTNVDSNYLYDKTKPLQFLTQAEPYLENLLNSAEEASLHLEVISAYRSFGTQGNLKSAYDVTYGEGTANQFSAEQGYSEHQLGTAVDFTTPTVADTFSGFSKTAEYTWLTNNAYLYGFILSYPPNNAYYVFEPWHWRFVGDSLAAYLHGTNQYFYDLDQRQIDTYLVKLFD